MRWFAVGSVFHHKYLGILSENTDGNNELFWHLFCDFFSKISTLCKTIGILFCSDPWLTRGDVKIILQIVTWELSKSWTLQNSFTCRVSFPSLHVAVFLGSSTLTVKSVQGTAQDTRYYKSPRRKQMLPLFSCWSLSSWHVLFSCLTRFNANSLIWAVSAGRPPESFE